MRVRALMLAFVLICTASTQAAVFPLTVSPADFNALGTWQPVAGWPVATTMMAGLDLAADVTHQVFQDSATGGYAYLYQVENTGLDQSWHIIEVLSLTDFTGADENTTLGYLTAGEPAPFQAGGTVSPIGASVNTLSGPTISFGFMGFFDPIEVGEVSEVLYILSDLGPTMITGNVIDGSIADGSVVGPVPEPATMSLLAIGALAMLRRKRK